MTTIFCDFRQFWAKNLAFFTKTIVMIQIFAHFRFGLSKKTPIVSPKFLAKIFKKS
jgi:hypothetical protein